MLPRWLAISARLAYDRRVAARSRAISIASAGRARLIARQAERLGQSPAHQRIAQRHQHQRQRDLVRSIRAARHRLGRSSSTSSWIASTIGSSASSLPDSSIQPGQRARRPRCRTHRTSGRPLRAASRCPRALREHRIGDRRAHRCGEMRGERLLQPRSRAEMMQQVGMGPPDPRPPPPSASPLCGPVSISSARAASSAARRLSSGGRRFLIDIGVS